MDSDAVLPEGYLREIDKCVEEIPCDLWGGPDRAREDFTIIQKAINYSMTSLLTTGGIRGKKKSVDHFYPRTFNMGIRREPLQSAWGFRPHMRYGEDLDLSMRFSGEWSQVSTLSRRVGLPQEESLLPKAFSDRYTTVAKPV